jgi:hypothetical protein
MKITGKNVHVGATNTGKFYPAQNFTGFYIWRWNIFPDKVIVSFKNCGFHKNGIVFTGSENTLKS